MKILENIACIFLGLLSMLFLLLIILVKASTPLLVLYCLYKLAMILMGA